MDMEMENKLGDRIKALLYQRGYMLKKQIGKGSYGECYICYSSKYSMDFVCKVFYLPNNEKKQIIRKSFETECNALTRVMHPNIINIFDYFSCDDILCIILEYCENGSVQNLINTGERLDDNRMFHYTKNLVDALQYCHSHHFVHMDIKPGNLLIDKAGRVKLADFGLARIWDTAQEMRIFSGSYAYMAPEILKKKPFDPYKADVWSLGATIYHIYTGHLPFIAKTISSFIGLIELGYKELPPNTPDYIRQIVQYCLVPDPDKRPTMQDIQAMMASHNLMNVDRIQSSADFKMLRASGRARPKRAAPPQSILKRSASNLAFHVSTLASYVKKPSAVTPILPALKQTEA